MAPRSVLISGTSTGIGAACVARLAAEGWRVYAGVRKEADADRLTADVQGDVVPVILDVTNASHIASVLARVEDDVGQLEGLVNNAGVGQGGPIELLGDQDWQSTFDVNFFGLVALTREAFPLVRRGEGRFVHIGSIAGRVGGGG
ncbi:MAG: SDR family NAD(P)-dependent oxidoreductase, partial [Acidimicrobiia bacterium]|nr:SDR family NAD(P)-dependent oxidoreductase [Acidimicrobiia bacterium]